MSFQVLHASLNGMFLKKAHDYVLTDFGFLWCMIYQGALLIYFPSFGHCAKSNCLLEHSLMR